MRHADNAAGTERDPHGRVTALVTRRGRDADIRAHRQRHAEVADRGREARRPMRKKTSDRPGPHVIGAGSRNSRPTNQDDEDRQRPELPVEVGRGALLHGQRDGLHALGAFAGSEHLPAEQARHHQRRERDQRDDDDVGQVAARQ